MATSQEVAAATYKAAQRQLAKLSRRLDKLMRPRKVVQRRVLCMPDACLLYCDQAIFILRYLRKKAARRGVLWIMFWRFHLGIRW
jgi:Ribonuclease G/E